MAQREDESEVGAGARPSSLDRALQKLPTPCKLLEAQDWLRAGAPAASRHHDAVEAVRTLAQLIEALPAILPVYCYGTPENRAAMLACQDEPKDTKDDTG